MANIVRHELEEIEVAKNQVKDTLRCILHSIFLTRAFGPIAPSEIACECGIDLSYFTCNVRSIDVAIEAAIESSFSKMQKIGPELARCCLLLQFKNKKERKALFGWYDNAVLQPLP